MQKTKGYVRVSVVVGLLIAGCAHGNSSVALSGSSLLPAAEGRVTLSGKEQNKTLHLVVHHLAEPQNLNTQTVAPSSNASSPPQVYVVWLQPTGAGPDNIGTLMPDKNLDAELTTTTAQKRFEIFITAEPSATMTAPTGQRLMQATVQD
jgi:hypothetical protein